MLERLLDLLSGVFLMVSAAALLLGRLKYLKGPAGVTFVRPCRDALQQTNDQYSFEEALVTMFMLLKINYSCFVADIDSNMAAGRIGQGKVGCGAQQQ
jgi:hypothetical protein